MPTVSVEINGVNVDDSVLSGKFPQKDRERDYTPKATGLKLIVSDDIVEPVKNDLVELFINSDEHYLGWLEDFERNYKNHTYEIDVRGYLLRLDEKLITYDNVHDIIFSPPTDDDYIQVDNEGKPNMSLKWLITTLFDDCGMTLDSSNIDSQVLFNHAVDEVNYTFNWGQLVIDENMLYALGQSIATNHNELDAGENSIDFYKNKITYWEFISFIFSCFGFSIRYIGDSTTKTFELTPQGRTASTGLVNANNDVFYSIIDDEKYDYKNKLVLRRSNGYAHVGKYLDRSFYLTDSHDSLDEHSATRVNSGGVNIDVFNNLRILLRDQVTYPGFGYVFDSQISLGHDFHYGNLLENKTNSVIMNFQKEEISCPIKASSHQIKREMINLRTLTSEIIQEQNLMASG